MPRSPSTYSLPPGTTPQQPNTVISSSMFNAFADDVAQTFNTVQPIVYGGTGSNDLKLTDTDFGIKDNGDPTKIGQFNASGLPTATTRTYDLPYYSGTLGLVSDIRGQIYGLTMSNNGTDPINDIDVASGSAVDSSGTTSMLLASSITKRLDAAWAVGSGNGGLDTGAIANTTYHVYLIRRPDTGVVDVCFSASASAPTTGGSIPAAYTQYRRIGSIRRDAGAIRLFDQYGDFFQLKVPALDINVSIGVTTAVLYSLTVPNGIKVQALLNFSLFSTNVVYVLLTSPDQTDSVPSASLFTHLNGTAGNYGGGYAQPITDTSGRVRARASVAATSLFGTTNGWIDKRGRDV